MRDRRVAATYLLGRDHQAWVVARGMARALSAYERAFLRLFVMGLIEDWFTLDAPLVWLARRITFALARRPRDYEDPLLDAEVDLSEWTGNVWILVVWSVAVGSAIWLLRRWLPA